MPGAGQFDIPCGAGGRGLEPLDERPRVRDRKQEVGAAVNDEKRWRSCTYTAYRGCVAKHVRRVSLPSSDNHTLAEFDEPSAVWRWSGRPSRT